MDLMKSLKHKFGADGGTQNHPVTMSNEHMKAIHDHILSVCPGEKSDCLTLGDKDLHMQLLMYLAFSTLSWTLWTW